MVAEAAHRSVAVIGARDGGGDLLVGTGEGGVIAAVGIADEEWTGWGECSERVNAPEGTRVLHQDPAEVVHVEDEDGVGCGRELG